MKNVIYLEHNEAADRRYLAEPARRWVERLQAVAIIRRREQLEQLKEWSIG